MKKLSKDEMKKVNGGGTICSNACRADYGNCRAACPQGAAQCYNDCLSGFNWCMDHCETSD